jgi:hypothetical protein
MSSKRIELGARGPHEATPLQASRRVYLRTAALLSAAPGVLALLPGCAALRPTREPVDTIWDRLPTPQAPSEKILIVFLPGAGDTAQEIVNEGFVQQVRQRGLVADVVVVDLHLGYYTRSRNFEVRLREDVIAPARAAGYRQVWLAGISLGGFGSLMFSRVNQDRPETQIDGIIALAPYVARTSVLDEVVRAGGLARWNEPVVQGDFERELLQWLKAYGDPSLQRPALYLGYGTEDGFAQMAQAVGALLPAGRLRSAPGGHDWPPWKRLWGEFLDAVPWPNAARTAKP